MSELSEREIRAKVLQLFTRIVAGEEPTPVDLATVGELVENLLADIHRIAVACEKEFGKTP